MENGLLFVDLSQPINNEESKKIEIKDNKNKIKDKLISLEMEDQTDKNNEYQALLSDNENLSYAFVKKEITKKIISQRCFLSLWLDELF